MSYQSLRELFYLDVSSDRFAAADLRATKRMEAESTFRTGILTPNGELFLAVPRELSLLNEEVLRQERRISQLTGDLPPIALGALVRSLVVDEIVNSNDLEGVHSTRRQINDLLITANGAGRNDDLRRFREFARLYLGISDPHRTYPTDPAGIRKIYDLVMQGEALGSNAPDGALFRKEGVQVIGEGGKVLHEGLFPESEIIKGMRQMLDIVESPQIPQAYGAIVGHYVFEYVHPFYDGNGRTGRYLLALYLSRPLSMLTCLSLSRVIAQNRGKYYKSFREVEHKLNHGELTMFVMNMLENVRIAQQGLDGELLVKRQQLSIAESRLSQLKSEAGLSIKERDVMYLLAQIALFGAFPDVTLQEIADYAGVKAQQARKYARRLVELGLVGQHRSRELHFTLSSKAAAYLEIPSEILG